jgi:CheY-like chemotaxis protein
MHGGLHLFSLNNPPELRLFPRVEAKKPYSPGTLALVDGSSNRKYKRATEARPDVAGRGTEHKGTVLVVEDEPLIMLELQHMLAELGWHVPFLASDVDTALELAQREALDVGILDVNLKGRTSFPVADVLQKRNVPIILATGYSTEVIIENYPYAIYLQKPYIKNDLAKALSDALAQSSQDSERQRALR